jgi:quercetin dioxygenase-like cupin family protein
MRKWIAIGTATLVGYLLASCLLHYLVFPEPAPDPADVPRSGKLLVNEGIRSKFVYRRTSIETGGQLFEWDNFVEPGGGPIDIPHVHPRMRETFEVIDGEMRFVVDGHDHVLAAGSTLIAEPGTVHAFQNVSGRAVHMISRFEPAEEGPWEELAQKGLLPDNAFVQIERAGGLGSVSPIQMLVLGARFKQGHPPLLPEWAWNTIAFVIAPTARVFGVHSYYPPPR